MIRRSFMFMAVVVGLNAATLWALTGTLKDNNNKPLADADVYLVNKDIHDLTDAMGTFSFSENAVRRGITGSHTRFSAPVLIGNRLCFNLAKGGDVEYAVYSVKGGCLFRYKNTLDKGDHLLPIAKGYTPLAKGVYVVALRTEGVVKTLMYNSVSVNKYNGAFSSKEPLNDPKSVSISKSAANTLIVIDTLIITKVVGDVTSMRKIRIYGYDDNINSAAYVSNGLQMVILDPSNDNDGDGFTNFEERYLYSTNSELFDTDGDGMGDASEIRDNTSPLISNYPSVAFVAKSYPIIVANFSQSVDEQTGREISSGGDYSFTNSYSTQQQVNASVSVALMVGGEISAEGPTATGSITATVGAGWSMTFGSDQSQSVSRNWNNAETYARSKGVTINGGRIKIDVELINNSTVNVTLLNPMIRLSATEFGLSTLSSEIGELTLFTGDGISGDNEVTIPFLAGSNRVTRQFGINLSNPDIIEKVAKNSCGLKAQLTNIRFKTSLGEADTLMANIYRRTSEVIIDFGQSVASPNNLIKQRVASRAIYNDFYTNQTDRYLSSSLFDLLNTAGVTPIIGTDSGATGITEINGVKNGVLKNGIWSVVCQATPDSLRMYSTKFTSYDPRTIRVGMSSVISCVYDTDIDGDGLPTRVEAVLGTDDTKTDTDGDSISDRDEFMGWRRGPDPVGVTWKTNPLLTDTDLDTLDDFVDPDPLVPEVSALDSTVAFSTLTLSSLQGSAWTNTAPTADSLTTIATASTMRGPATISMSFSHPVFMVSIICKTKPDTVRLFTPDSAGFYKANINLALGANDVLITAISKNGTLTKKVLLTGIQRRLAAVDPANQSMIKVTFPSNDKYGKSMECYIGFDEVKKLDPYISNVLLVRTTILAVPISTADKAAKMVGNDLGDNGSGSASPGVGSELIGSGIHYLVRGVLNTNTTMSDTGLLRQNDYAYFLYTAHISNGNQYYTAPRGTGIFKGHDRTVLVDSAMAIMNNKLPWQWGGIGPFDFQYIVQPVVAVGATGATLSGQSNWQATGTGKYKRVTVNCSAAELVSTDSIRFLPFNTEGNFRANDGSAGWRNYHNLPSSVSYTKFVGQASGLPVDMGDGYTYKEMKVGTYEETHWCASPAFTLAGLTGYSVYFDVGFQIYWRYKFGPK